MFSTIVSWVLSYYPLISTLIVAHLLYEKFGRGLSKYPGPFLASITNWWRFYDVIANRSKPPMAALHKKYGKIVRYGPGMLSFSDPKAIKDIYLGTETLPKSDYYTISDFYIHGVKHQSLFGTQNEKWHSKLKRGVGPAFTMTAVAGLEEYVDKTIDFFMELTTSRFGDEKSSVDLVTWIQYFAFDVLGQLLYGQRHGFLEKGGDIEDIMNTVSVANQYALVVGQVPWLDRLLIKNPLLVWLQSKGYLDMTFHIVPFAMNHIAQRSKRAQVDAGDNSTADLLDRILTLQRKDPETVTDTEIVKLCAMLVFAGSDTTAITLAALFYYLMKNPSIYAKLQNEIDTSTAISRNQIAFSDAQAMLYLDACLKETLRIHPAAAFNIERVVQSGGRTISGDFIPAGTIVSMNGWAVHQDESTFGPDVDVFRPERWLEDEGKAAEMWKYMFHFGAGNHLCFGKNIAMLEMYKFIPIFLRNFKLELKDPNKDWTLANGVFMRPMDLNVKILKR